MSKPQLERFGDSFALSWGDVGIGFGVDRLRDSSDGLKGELTVEGNTAGARGRVYGPVAFNLLSSRSQSEVANILSKRVNGLSAEQWTGMVIQACAMVAANWREPTPSVCLSKVANIPEVRYLVPGLIPAGETTVLYGDGESAKSLAALYIGACVDLGVELVWGARPAAGRVLYLDWETNTGTVASRLNRLAQGMGFTVPNILYRQCIRSLIDELPSLREEVARADIQLVVVDSIGFAVTGALVEDETARAAMNALRTFGPCSRLVVAHVSRADADQSRRVKPFGSAFFWNGMRSGIEARRAEDQPDDDVIDVGLFHRKANDGLHHRPIGLRVSFDGTGGPITFRKAELSDVPDFVARTPLSERIRAMLRVEKASLKEIAGQVDAKEDTVYRTLKRMPDVIQLFGGGGRGKDSEWGLEA